MMAHFLLQEMQKKKKHIDGETISYIEFGYMPPYIQIYLTCSVEKAHDEVPHVILKKVSHEVFHRCAVKNSFDLLRVFPIPKYTIALHQKLDQKMGEKKWGDIDVHYPPTFHLMAAAPNNLSLLLLFISNMSSPFCFSRLGALSKPGDETAQRILVWRTRDNYAKVILII